MPAPKIIIAGAPASGKGTQCELIRDKYGVVHLSTGDMLREAAAKGTEVGVLAEQYMEQGKLVPDEVIIGAVKERLALPDCQEKGWLLDGFPRTGAQAEALRSAGLNADVFLFLAVPDAELVERVKSAPDQTLRLQAERGGKQLNLSLTPADLSGIGRIGAQLQPSGTEAFRRAKGPGEILRQANHDFGSLTQRTVEGFITLATHFGETASQVSGPVKIVEMGASLAKQGGSSLFLYTALISINLAVLNALPLPLLDGGQFVFLMIEGLRGKPLPEKFQLAFMQSGFVFLVGLSLVLIVKDTSQLAAVQQLLGR
jgi:adenylate kinase family enzyme